MRNSNYYLELVEAQAKLFNIVKPMLTNFSFKSLNKILDEKKVIFDLLDFLVEESVNSKEAYHFDNVSRIYRALIFYSEWIYALLNGLDNSVTTYKTAKSNLSIIDTTFYHHIPIFKFNIDELINNLSALNDSNFNEFEIIVRNFGKVRFPIISHLRSNGFINVNNINSTNDEVEENDDSVYVVSLELFLQGSPWVNPQIIKSKQIYAIDGIIKLNKIPKRFSILKVVPATTSLNIFEIELQEIILSDSLEYKLTGTIVFKYNHSSFESSTTIKILPHFVDDYKNVLYPTIIGYDELSVKSIHPNSKLFQGSGYELIDEKISEIYSNSLLNRLNENDKNNFLMLLNGICNFQGFCLQRAKYKEINSIKEDEFRDDLIQHLTANPNIGEDIIKEAHVAGGRVEIIYKGIIVELKVEKSLSDRGKIISKYKNQPQAYASSNSKICSIACVLDLTEKKLPQSLASNNIFIHEIDTHGFESTIPFHQPFQVFIFIDGNIKSPSKYSI
ncbi:hypothetical protein D3C71_05990 [compost metagenome]